MVFCINLHHIKIQLSFTLTNFKHSVLISKENILAIAKKTILSESESITKLTDYLDENFADATQAIYNSKGRLIVTGIGKSAIIAKKMVASFNSTGTPSMFLHASEAIHGDLTRFDVFAGMPWYPFPGGRMFQVPYSTVGSWWYGLRDRIGV